MRADANSTHKFQTGPAPYIFLSWVELMLADFRDRHVEGQAVCPPEVRAKECLTYYDNPLKLVTDGLRLSRVQETWSEQSLKLEWSTGTGGTKLAATARDFGQYLVMCCQGELKQGAAPKTSIERHLTRWLADSKSIRN